MHEHHRESDSSGPAGPTPVKRIGPLDRPYLPCSYHLYYIIYRSLRDKRSKTHQTLHLLLGLYTAPGLQLKAAANSGILTSAPLTRNLVGLWGSTYTGGACGIQCQRTAQARAASHLEARVRLVAQMAMPHRSLSTDPTAHSFAPTARSMIVSRGQGLPVRTWRSSIAGRAWLHHTRPKLMKKSCSCV